MLVDDSNIEPESATPLLEIIKSSVETVAFHELVGAIEEGTPAALLHLFEDWRVIEARAHLKLADGRREVIDKLEKFIDEGALEVKEVQPLFEKNLWLLDPAWTEAHFQPTYTWLIRKYCKEEKDISEEDRRLDIMGISSGGTVTIVELKRPEATLSRKNLDQIEDYVDWARENIAGGSGPDSPKYVNGLLVVGIISSQKGILKKVERLAGDDMRVQTFRDLHERSRQYYGEVDKILRNVAPEYSRTRRKNAW